VPGVGAVIGEDDQVNGFVYPSFHYLSVVDKESAEPTAAQSAVLIGKIETN